MCFITYHICMRSNIISPFPLPILDQSFYIKYITIKNRESLFLSPHTGPDLTLISPISPRSGPGAELEGCGWVTSLVLESRGRSHPRAQGEYVLRFPNCPLLPSFLVIFPPISCPSPNSPAIRASVGVAPVQAALTEDLRLGSL